MKHVIQSLALLLVTVFLAACAGTPSQALQPVATKTENPVTEVFVTRDAGVFRARFVFPQDARIWAFHRSALRRIDRMPWRPDSWKIVTSGVELERIGNHDALVATAGTIPREVTIEFVPAAVDLIADYDPALILTDGTTALFAGAFTAFPTNDPAALAATKGRGSVQSRIIFTGDEGPVFHQGRQVTRAVDDGTGYAIYGDVEAQEGSSVARIFDPALPDWLAGQLDTATPAIFAHYTRKLGPHAGGRPMVLASWVPSDMQGVSRGGSVLPGMITMRFEGAGLLQPNPEVLNGSLWFIAHEAAHFWLGETIRYDTRDRAWITEGGADLLAMRTAEALRKDFSADAIIAGARTDCASALEKSGVESARLRNEQHPYYACGALFALAVEAAGEPRGEDYFDFVAGLIADQKDGEIDGTEWLAAAGAFGLELSKVETIRRLLKEGSKTPQRDIASLIDG